MNQRFIFTHATLSEMNQRNASIERSDTERSDIRVLLVEDSRLIAEQMLELVQSVPGVTPISVVDTEEAAIDAATKFSPDLVILDLHLKQGNGFGVLKALAEIEQPPTVAVLTNYALPKYRDLAELCGAHFFLDKSRDFERLPEIIEKISHERGNLLEALAVTH